MLYSEGMTNHAIIGEAAVNLAVRKQDITVDTLTRELSSMLQSESLPERVLMLRAAIGWLKDIRPLSKRDAEMPRWMSASPGDNAPGSDSIIRLRPDDNENDPG